MLNGRIGIKYFTHVSHGRRSVVDYVFVPYEQLLGVDSFEVCLMTKLTEKLNMQGNSEILAHQIEKSYVLPHLINSYLTLVISPRSHSAFKYFFLTLVV